MSKQTTISRNADKFVVRMPDEMRGRLVDLAKRLNSSMNSVIIFGLTSYLDALEELTIQLDALRLLRQSLNEKHEALDSQLAEVAELKAQLIDRVNDGN